MRAVLLVAILAPSVMRCADAPHLAISVERGDQLEPLHPGALAVEGDRLAVFYDLDTDVEGAILSIDGRGLVSTWLPYQGARSVAIDHPDRLDFSIALDDAPSFERFVYLTARRPFALGPVREALARGEPLPAGLSVSTFELRKPDHD